MKTSTTADLIQDLLAVHFQVQRHVQDTRRRLTPLQVEVIIGSVTSLNRFLIAGHTALAATGNGRTLRPRLTCADPLS